MVGLIYSIIINIEFMKNHTFKFCILKFNFSDNPIMKNQENIKPKQT
jgi:hypothetical protein